MEIPVVSLSVPEPAPQIRKLPSAETKETRDTSGSFFHPTNQEILKGIVSSEVNSVLDKLKTERPELVNQAEVMNIVTQRTRKFEDSLQQYNVREQRLRDKVENMEVTLRAVQGNIDEVKQDNGGTYITEDVMRSWVSHFFNEQTEEIRTNVQGELEKRFLASNQTNDKLGRTVIGLQEQVSMLRKDNDSLKEQNQSLTHVMDTANKTFENTVQNIYEASCFTYGKVVNDVKVYKDADATTEEAWDLTDGERVILYYPIEGDGENNIWMKTRRVDVHNAGIEEGWVPIILGGDVFVGEFGL
jgi:hypothetical protein